MYRRFFLYLYVPETNENVRWVPVFFYFISSENKSTVMLNKYFYFQIGLIA